LRVVVFPQAVSDYGSVTNAHDARESSRRGGGKSLERSQIFAQKILKKTSNHSLHWVKKRRPKKGEAAGHPRRFWFLAAGKITCNKKVWFGV
jgi:hypothetical protein